MLLLTACRKDTDNVTITEDVPTPPVITAWQPLIENINGDLTGQVYDENKLPVSNAAVKINGQTTTTSEDGIFHFSNIQMNSKGAYVTVEKAGYFLGSRRFFPKAEKNSNVKIQMLEMGQGATLTATIGGTVTTNGGATVTFPANAIVTQDGAVYEGDFKVHSKWLDPSDANMLAQMPGNLQAITTNSQEAVLMTLGMMTVELRDLVGTELKVAEGKKATLNFPVPVELQANAPANIPLWSFNEEYGMWVEEGSAILENGVYVGEVAHFSFWNCDWPFTDFVNFEVTFQDQNGNPLVNHSVKLTLEESYGCSYGVTDENGYVAGLVPADEPLHMEILSAQLCDVLYEDEVGSFSEDTDLGVITVEVDYSTNTVVSGTVVDCNGDGVGNSLIVIRRDGGVISNVQTSEDGTFNVVIDICASNGNLDLYAVNLEDFLQSEIIELTVGEENSIGNIATCDQALESGYISITIDNQTRLFGNAIASVSGGNTVISSEEIAGSFCSISCLGIDVGTYVASEDEHTPLGIFSPDANWSYFSLEGNPVTSTFTFTEYGENIIGTFSSMVRDTLNEQDIPVTGSFNIPTGGIFDVTLDGNTTRLLGSNVSIVNDSTYIEYDSYDDTKLKFAFNGQSAGEYNDDQNRIIQIYGIGIFGVNGFVNESVSNCNVTQYDNQIEGSFSGVLTNNAGVDVPISCDFAVPNE